MDANAIINAAAHVLRCEARWRQITSAQCGIGPRPSDLDVEFASCDRDNAFSALFDALPSEVTAHLPPTVWVDGQAAKP